LKIASWNVNSIKVRIDHVLEWLDYAKPDVLGLQELKLPSENFPHAALAEVGYSCLVNGQKTYNGVALLSRTEGIDPIVDLPGFDDPQRRVLAATYGDTRIINLYVPNGQSVGSDKYDYKLSWLNALHKWVAAEAAAHKKLCVFGDFNIAPTDADVHDPKAWQGKILCSDAERAALQALLDLGLKDSFRLFEQPEESFSWWDYRMAGFRRNLGLRIDLILASAAIADSAAAAGIDKEPRALERPSDHAPVWLEFD
jgi:exodeoxyribonuclease III